jgi:hypothetical protein
MLMLTYLPTYKEFYYVLPLAYLPTYLNQLIGIYLPTHQLRGGQSIRILQGHE